MRTAMELVDELVRGLLPSLQGVLMVNDVARRAEEFAAVAGRAEPGSPERAIAASCGDYLNKLHRSLVATAFRS